uniref:Methenyltetrahydromethanopterin cyclohydrolase n=1 Tax=Lygus hesperus TaxID=30085 RepID=A0A0A9XU17_LYGHE
MSCHHPTHVYAPSGLCTVLRFQHTSALHFCSHIRTSPTLRSTTVCVPATLLHCTHCQHFVLVRSDPQSLFFAFVSTLVRLRTASRWCFCRRSPQVDAPTLLAVGTTSLAATCVAQSTYSLCLLGVSTAAPSALSPAPFAPMFVTPSPNH